MLRNCCSRSKTARQLNNILKCGVGTGIMYLIFQKCTGRRGQESFMALREERVERSWAPHLPNVSEIGNFKAH